MDFSFLEDIVLRLMLPLYSFLVLELMGVLVGHIIEIMQDTIGHPSLMES